MRCSASTALNLQQAYAFCQALPKVDLHAHLSGSARLSTLRELAAMQGLDTRSLTFDNSASLSECFEIFAQLSRIISDLSNVRRIAREAVEDAADDNVALLELRTTPKCFSGVRGLPTTREEYVSAALAGMRDATKSCISSLILCVDRGADTEETSVEVVQIAIAMRDRGQPVVGIDLCGDPNKGDFSTFEKALKLARDANLGITLHAGEIANPGELDAMIAFGPHRYGHLCFATEAQRRKIEGGIELCLSSNVATRSVKDLESHHLAAFRASGAAIAICTDDPTLFSTSPSREHALAMHTFKLSQQDMVQLVERAIGMSFTDVQTKQTVGDRLHSWWSETSGKGS